MAIKQPQGGGGVMNSKAFGVGLGVATGNPMMAVGSLTQGSPAGNMMGAASKLGDIGGAPPNQIDSTSEPYNAISARLQAKSQDPNMAINQGLNALKDPSVPDYVRQQYAEPLLRAKYKINGGGGIA